MNKFFLLLISIAAITITAQAGDLYKVENGSYVSTDFPSLNLLLHTQHGTNRYRAIRDVLISQGTLIPCDPIVEVITNDGNGISTILGRYGHRSRNAVLNREDLNAFFLSGKSTRRAPAQFSWGNRV